MPVSASSTANDRRPDSRSRAPRPSPPLPAPTIAISALSILCEPTRASLRSTPGLPWRRGLTRPRRGLRQPDLDRPVAHADVVDRLGGDGGAADDRAVLQAEAAAVQRAG